MFKRTQRKLTLIYTISFLLLLLSFIAILYYFITKALDQEQLRELEGFTHGQMDDLIGQLTEHEDPEEQHNKFEDNHDHEDDHEQEYKTENDHEQEYNSENNHELEYKPERALFYYVFDKNGALIAGEETISGFREKAKQELSKVSYRTVTIKTEWHNTHLIYQLVPIKWEHQFIGTVVVGKDITSQHHFIRNVLIIIAILTFVFTILLALLSYYLASKAMGPIQSSYEKQRKFVSDASHELRTPLSIFLGSVELLEREEKERLSPLGHEVLDDLKTETMHMSKLLENLLFLSRSDQNRQKINKEPINLSSLLQSICHRFQPIVPDSIDLTCNIKEEIYIQADANHIQQLMYILLENALHYTESGNICVSLATSNQQVLIEVSDSGQGIEANDIPHIFDRFYRADDTRDRSGVGLGLSIAKTIIENHQGTIRVSSTPGVGTTFFITLPYN